LTRGTAQQSLIRFSVTTPNLIRTAVFERADQKASMKPVFATLLLNAGDQIQLKFSLDDGKKICEMQ
jgi:hypothetical protein